MSSIPDAFEVESVNEIINQTAPDMLAEITTQLRSLADEYTSDEDIMQYMVHVGLRAFVAGCSWVSESMPDPEEVPTDRITISAKVAQRLLDDAYGDGEA